MSILATRKVPTFLTLTWLAGWLFLAGCNPVSRPADRYPADATQSDTTTIDGTVHKAGNLLSAFFGLDNGLPRQANLGICQGAGNADGMPVIFAQEVDVSTLQAGDFRVVAQSGKVGEIVCVTLFPAIDLGELRTVLLVGEFGSEPADPPATVAIVGNLLSLDGGINFKSAQIAVTPLPLGPTLTMAEIVPPADWQLGKNGGPRGNGSGCPAGTIQIVRVVWSGGVVKGNGAEADDVEREAYKVVLAQADGSSRTIVPFALADLDDGDNNHLLCLNQTGEPRAIDFPAGLLADPNGDLNPATTVLITPSLAKLTATATTRRQSMELLVRTEESIERIAETVGFGTGFALSKAFKRIAGVSPAALSAAGDHLTFRLSLLTSNDHSRWISTTAPST